jgi:argininosuccinate lyase
MHGLLHGLPLTYNKDLQEDKEHLFDAADTLDLCLVAARGMFDGVVFDRDRLAAAASDEMIAAVDVADLLVRRGMPFREAHGIVGSLVRLAEDTGRCLSELTPDELRSRSEKLDDEYYSVLSESSWLESKISVGGTAGVRVREQLAAARRALAAGA